MCYYSHIMLETYCGIDIEKDKIPKFCILGAKKTGYHCYENDCEFKACTKVPNQISYVDENSVCRYDIGFGGEMCPDDFDDDKTKELLKIWKEICIKKIDEAFDEFMEIKSKL